MSAVWLFRVSLFLFFVSSVFAKTALEDDSDANCFEEVISDNYSLRFHVIGLFIIFGTSGLGTGSTIYLGKYIHSNEIAMKVMQLLKMFGIGIMVSTAWIHLLPDALEQFSDPCLPDDWKSYGVAYVGLFAMIASFIVQLIEFNISDATGLSHSHDVNVLNSTEIEDDPITEGIVRRYSVASVRPNVETILNSPNPLDENLLKVYKSNSIEEESDDTQLQNSRNAAFSVALLEGGIIVHSFIIGLTLGVIADDEYTSLLFAIAFHQLFEGMALGALISSVTFPTKCAKILLCVAYPLTTPIGNAIGIGIRSVFNSKSPNVILAQGILGSLSAGILFYNSYAELISSEINKSNSFRKLSKTMQRVSFFCMYVGAASMAIIGIWA